MDGRCIVIVDDDDLVREGIAMTLEVAGYRIRSTGSGHDALRWLDEEPCDLLIVDINMPEMDGPQLYRRVLARWTTNAPRALFVSGADEVGAREEDPDVLAVPRLIKPFSIGALLAAVNQALEPAGHVGEAGGRYPIG
jgi:DNA-binding response OmpR family regulator